MAHHVFTDDNFEEEVLKSDKPVLVDFYADWCGPCKMLSPVVEELAQEYEGKWKIGKCNIDESPKISEKYGIRSIPTLMFFKNGEKADQILGFVAKEKITAKLV